MYLGGKLRGGLEVYEKVRRHREPCCGDSVYEPSCLANGIPPVASVDVRKVVQRLTIARALSGEGTTVGALAVTCAHRPSCWSLALVS